MLEAVHLSKSYNGAQALKDLNLQIEKGEVFCLLGANGAGKTTTINLFLNFTQPTEGMAKIKGLWYSSPSSGDVSRVSSQCCKERRLQ
jgi:ABC-2 type transport system ATP-binding protein